MGFLRRGAPLPWAVPVLFLFPFGLGGQSVAELPDRDRPLVVETTENFSVGSISGADWESFSRVAGVAFDGQGNLYILDAENFRVVKVDPQGRFLAEMGRKGGGPGEFGMPMGLAVTPEGEVRVFDFGNQGFVVFHPNGKFKTTVPLGGGGEFEVIPTGTLFVHPDGRMVQSEDGRLSIRMGPDGEPEIPSTRALYVFSLTDQVESELIYEGWNPVAQSRMERTGGAGLSIQAPPMRAFDPALRVGVLPTGEIAVADSSTYEIKLLAADGSHRRTIRRPLTPRPVTRRDQEMERRRALERMEASGGPTIVMQTSEGTSRMASDQARQMIEDRINAMQFGTEIPVISGMAVDREGRIWLGRAGPRVGEAGPVDVISGAGEYLGTIPPGELEIPDAFGPGGVAAYIESDELDVPSVVVRRLQIR